MNKDNTCTINHDGNHVGKKSRKHENKDGENTKEHGFLSGVASVIADLYRLSGVNLEKKQIHCKNCEQTDEKNRRRNHTVQCYTAKDQSVRTPKSLDVSLNATQNLALLRGTLNARILKNPPSVRVDLALYTAFFAFSNVSCDKRDMAYIFTIARTV